MNVLSSRPRSLPHLLTASSARGWFVCAGTQVAFTFSASTSVKADFMIPSVRVLDFKVDIHMDYVNCTEPPMKIQQPVMAIRINVV